MKAVKIALGKLILLVGCIAPFASAHVFANDPAGRSYNLTEEQSRLLHGYHQPMPANYDIHTLSYTFANQVPLITFELTAETNLMKGNALELGANYQSWGVSSTFNDIGFSSYKTSFTVLAPLQQAMDFSKSIREKVELCPEKILDKVVIDGAVSLNFNW
jgi:hypothetical protein